MTILVWVRAIFVVLLAFSITVAFAQAPDVEPVRPLDVVAALRQLVNDRVIGRDDLYTELELRRRFGKLAKIQIGESSAIERQATVTGFSGIAFPPVDGPPGDIGIYIMLGRYLWPRGPSGVLTCYVDVDFHGIQTGMDADSVVALLGSDWRRDKEAERERYRAWTREAFNPPFPKTRVAMGNAIVTYGHGDTRFELQFDQFGLLSSFSTPRLPC